MATKVDSSMNCCKCAKSLIGQRAICASGRCYHLACFCCVSCSKQLPMQYCSVDGDPCCRDCWFNKFAPKCYGCEKPIEATECVTLLGHDFHPECARCSKCTKTLQGDQYFPFKEIAYCYDCHWKVRMQVHQERLKHTVELKKSVG